MFSFSPTLNAIYAENESDRRKEKILQAVKLFYIFG
jgi:hypothetical protein